jgi:hypothetical protein
MTIECNKCRKRFGEPEAVGLLFTGILPRERAVVVRCRFSF